MNPTSSRQLPKAFFWKFSPKYKRVFSKSTPFAKSASRRMVRPFTPYCFPIRPAVPSLISRLLKSTWTSCPCCFFALEFPIGAPSAIFSASYCFPRRYDFCSSVRLRRPSWFLQIHLTPHTKEGRSPGAPPFCFRYTGASSHTSDSVGSGWRSRHRPRRPPRCCPGWPGRSG